VSRPQVADYLERLGCTPMTVTPAELRRFVASEIAR
jgi:hypothetical protein